MLAGLIFATEDATDRSGALAATLPFGGATLIEYQARLLIAAGASQVLVAVARVTPELLGAAARIRRRGVTVDVVRTAGEAAAKVHPLARVVVVADGLVTSEAVLAPIAAEGGDLLLVTDRDDGLERIDADSVWAGLARIGAQRLSEAAALPRDYDFLSSLLRMAAQHGAARRMLPAGAGDDGHGVEQDGGGLARRGRGVFAALAQARIPWVERWLLAPAARAALPWLVARGASPRGLLAVASGIGLLGLIALWSNWLVGGLIAIVLGSVGFLTSWMLAWLRGEELELRVADGGILALAGASVLLAGIVSDGAAATVLGIVTIAGAALVERVRGLVRPQRWWAAPTAYPLLLLPFATTGAVVWGLGATALYAWATLAGAIEAARAQP